MNSAKTSGHIAVKYITPENLWRVSTEICLSPDYHKLLQYGKKGLTIFNGPSWKGWSNGAARAWVRIDPSESTIWDKPYQTECGHGLNLRVTSFSREFHLDLGLGTPQRPAGQKSLKVKRAKGDAILSALTAPEVLAASHQAGNGKSSYKGNGAESNLNANRREMRSAEHCRSNPAGDESTFHAQIPEVRTCRQCNARPSKLRLVGSAS